jgi:hypothetical protein
MTYAEIMARAASACLNDTARQIYTDIVLLPYLNTALAELEEEFELNNLPVTNETSAAITVPTGITAIGFATVPALPSNLVEIQRLWESQTGQDIWIPLSRRDFITPYILPAGTELSNFNIWAWIDQEIRVRAAIVDIDIKIDYIKALFSEISIAQINVANAVVNSDTFLFYRIGGLAAEFIGENPVRAASLNGFAGQSLSKVTGISVKGMQSNSVRRRPFRAAFKRQRMIS